MDKKLATCRVVASSCLLVQDIIPSRNQYYINLKLCSGDLKKKKKS